TSAATRWWPPSTARTRAAARRSTSWRTTGSSPRSSPRTTSASSTSSTSTTPCCARGAAGSTSSPRPGTRETSRCWSRSLRRTRTGALRLAPRPALRVREQEVEHLVDVHGRDLPAGPHPHPLLRHLLCYLHLP